MRCCSRPPAEAGTGGPTALSRAARLRRRSAAGPVASGQAPPQPVGIATAEKGDIRVILNELGTVTSLANVTVKTQLNGYLTEVAFQEGQMVNKGDFLAQIDPRPYQVALEQAQGQLAHDQGLLQQAQTNLKRYQTLGKQDSIAQQSVDDQKYLVAAVHRHRAGRPGGDRLGEAEPRPTATSSRRSPAGSACARSTPATTSRPATRTASWS